MFAPLATARIPQVSAARQPRSRAARLASGLRRLHVQPSDNVVVLCCDDHHEDRVVACSASFEVGARAHVLDLELGAKELAEHLRRLCPSLVLACREGVDSWRRTKVPCRVVGDDHDVFWWKALELPARPVAHEADAGHPLRASRSG